MGTISASIKVRKKDQMLKAIHQVNIEMHPTISTIDRSRNGSFSHQLNQSMIETPQEVKQMDQMNSPVIDAQKPLVLHRQKLLKA